MSDEHWNKPAYQRIISAKLNGDELIVNFQDGSEVNLKLDSLVSRSTLNPDWDSFEFNPYEIVIPTANGQSEIPWTTIRLISDPEYASFWAQQAEDQSKDIGRRLSELRKRRNLTAKELAERVGISPQSLSRIENGYHDVVFTTLRRILAAMGFTLQDLVTVQVEPPLIQSMIKKLEAAGIKKEWLLKRVLSAEISTRLLQEADFGQDAIRDFARVVSAVFGCSTENVLDSQPLLLNYSVAQAAQFKAQSRVQEKQATAYSLYAHYLALVTLQAVAQIPFLPIPNSPNGIRTEIESKYGPINLVNMLLYVWDHGIPIIPLADSGAFHGASWNVSDRFVIVLKQVTKFQGRWLFDLSHELGHIALHLSGSNPGIVEVDEISPFSNITEEQEASDFARDLLFSDRSEELAEMSVEIAKGKVENLKSAVIQVASNEHVPVDLLANYLAFRLSKDNHINWWGAANNLQVTEPSPWAISKQLLLSKINPDVLSPDDLSLLQRALAD